VIIVGYICIAIAVVWFVFKSYVAYSSVGDTLGTVYLDAALYPPILTAFGLYWVLPMFNIHWTVWIFVGIWLVLAGLVFGFLKLMVELGDKEL
jgi:hypothetical protein